MDILLSRTEKSAALIEDVKNAVVNIFNMCQTSFMPRPHNLRMHVPTLYDTSVMPEAGQGLLLNFHAARAGSAHKGSPEGSASVDVLATHALLVGDRGDKPHVARPVGRRGKRRTD